MINEAEFRDSEENVIIFYADDDADDIDIFIDIVEDLNENTSIYTHNNGEELLHALKNPSLLPHLIFIDLNMPVINGFEVLSEIRQSDNLKNLPVIVFSTSNDEHTIAKSKKLGASFYIPKPNDYSTYKKSINHALRINWNTFNPDVNNFVYKNN